MKLSPSARARRALARLDIRALEQTIHKGADAPMCVRTISRYRDTAAAFERLPASASPRLYAVALRALASLLKVHRTMCALERARA